MKILATGDWHFGRNNDSRRHNEYLLEFIEFMVDYANENGIDRIIQCGDFFDNRTKMSVETMNYGIEGAKYIQENFDGDFEVLVGNHDMFYKNRVDVNSIRCIEPYAFLVMDTETFSTTTGEEILLTPWVCGGEHWDSIVEASKKADYIFGHFEFKNFYMNENYLMEHGVSHKELRDCKRVITGHYHKRQVKDNVIYAGSPFPFDYNDANDLERGFTVLDTETNEAVHVDWGKVKILKLDYDEFMEFQEEGIIDEHTSVRIDLPDDADDRLIEEATTAVSNLETSNSKINYKGNKVKELIESTVEVKEVDNVDQTIVEAIRGITEPPSDVDVETLAQIYELAIEEGTDED